MGDHHHHHHHVHCPKPRRPPSFLGSVPSFEEAESATFDVRAALDKLFNPTPEEFNAALENRFLPSNKTSAAAPPPTCKFVDGASSSTSTVPESAPRIGDTERPVTTDVSSSNPHPAAAAAAANLQAFDDDTCPLQPSEPNPAFQAFSMLRNDPGVQNVVASLISDQNLWEVVMNNKKVMEYMESFKNANKIDANQSSANATATGGEIIPTDGSNANQSTTATAPGGEIIQTDDSNANQSTTATAPGGEIIPTDGSSASDPISLTQAMKLRVLAIVRSLLELYQKIFGNPVAEEGSGSATEESSSGESIWKYTSITAPVMVLTIAVIMVVMVKRE